MRSKQKSVFCLASKPTGLTAQCCDEATSTPSSAASTKVCLFVCFFTPILGLLSGVDHSLLTVLDLSDLSDRWRRRRRRYVKTARMICSDIVFLSSCPFPHIFLKSFLFCVLEWVISHLADYHGEKLIS